MEPLQRWSHEWMLRTGKSFHRHGTLALPPAQQLQVTAGRSLTSESMRHVATVANDGLHRAPSRTDVHYQLGIMRTGRC
jgi:hypothetical protein